MSTALTSSNPPEVFISYSNKDEKLLKKLEVYLKVLQDKKIITLLDSHRTVPGINYEKEIEKNLSRAQIILLLVSEDFLASSPCRAESNRAMERHEREGTFVIPVILRPCTWHDSPFGKLQALPKDGEPVVLWNNRDKAFLNITEGVKKVADEIQPPTSSVKKIEVELDDVGDGYGYQKGFEQRLRIHVAVDLKRITISIVQGSIKIVIDGNGEELDRIVNALRDPELRLKLFETAEVRSIRYIQDQKEHSIPLEPLTPNNDDGPGFDPAGILTRAIRAVPAVKYALGVAGIAAAVAIVAGFSVDYKVAVLGTILMLGLMFGLVSFSSFAFNSTDAIRPLALTLAWTFVLLISGTSLFIFTGFFFDWPRPLEAYVRPRPTPSPLPSPSPTPPPSPTPTASPSPTPTPRSEIVVTERPPYNPIGGPTKTALIAGKVSGVRPEDYCIVIYSFTITWYVQPTTEEPRTPIGSDGTWRSVIQTGSMYDILLVPKDYQPPPTTSRRPSQLPGVLKWIEIEGKK